MQRPCREARQGKQATVGPEGTQAGQCIAHIPCSLPWLRALPAASKPGPLAPTAPMAPTAPSKAVPELDNPWLPSPACDQRGWHRGYPGSQAVPPQMVTHQPWQRKAPLLLRVQPVPESPLLTLGVMG